MVCFHQSEWGVEFSHLKSEIDTFLDKGINKEEDEGIKNILIERKNEALQITEAKVNALSFWKEVKVSGNSMPEGVTYEPHTNSCRKMHSWETEPILQPGESPSTLEQFPTNNKVYHFHPNMFVRQMRRLEDEGAPWMKCVFQEFETYKGINEDKSPLKERIIDHYHMSTTYAPAHYGTLKQWTQGTAWCASFVNWCFEQIEEYKGINTKGNAAAFDWGPYKSNKTSLKDGIDGWADGEECKAFLGAVIVLNYSHCAFIVGKNSKLNKYVYIGGNQGSGKSGTQQIKYGTVTIGKEFAIMKPKKYKVQSFNLPEIEQDADGNYKSTR